MRADPCARGPAMGNDAFFKEYGRPSRRTVIATLQNLIEVCRDGQRGYSCAADHVNDQWLRQLFWDYAQQRATFVADLERELVALGGHPEPHPTVAGWIHRKWLEVRASL